MSRDKNDLVPKRDVGLPIEQDVQRISVREHRSNIAPKTWMDAFMIQISPRADKDGGPGIEAVVDQMVQQIHKGCGVDPVYTSNRSRLSKKRIGEIYYQDLSREQLDWIFSNCDDTFVLSAGTVSEIPTQFIECAK